MKWRQTMSGRRAGSAPVSTLVPKFLPTLLPTFALAFGLAFALPAHAFDLLEAWDAASRNAPDAAVAEATRQVGAAREGQAGALWSPTVVLEGAAGYGSTSSSTRGARFAAPGFGVSDQVSFDTSVSGGASSRYALALRQPVYSRERDARSEVLRQGSTTARIESGATDQTLMLQTADAYFAVALAERRQALIERQLAAVQREAVEAQDRFRIGDRPVTDVHEAKARLATLQAERLEAGTRVELARNALSDLTGRPVAAGSIGLPGELHLSAIGTQSDWMTRVERDSPALKIAAIRLQTAQAQARANGAAFSPTVDVVARLAQDRISGDGSYGHASYASRNGMIGLQVSVPLYTGGMRSAQHDESAALVEKSRAEMDRVRLQVLQQARTQWLALSVGGQELAALAAAQDASRLRLDSTRVGLQAGDRTTLDLLNAENDATAAELALAGARVRLLLERMRLAAAAGALDLSVLREINAQLAPSAPDQGNEPH